MEMANRVLLVEDDENIQQLLSIYIRRTGASLDVASDGVHAIELLRATSYDLIFLDIMLPRMNGFEVAEEVVRSHPQTKLVVVSAIALYFEHRFPAGTIILQKPFDLNDVEAILRGRTSESAAS